MKINENYLDLKDSYLFSTIAQRVARVKEKNNAQRIISLGIGDVTRPLTQAVIDAMRKAVDEMGNEQTFRGYGEERGYSFLRQAVTAYYSKKGVILSDDEVFISDGAKSDIANILDITDAASTVLIPNPVYPVYVDTNIMLGRKIIYANGDTSNGFLPLPEDDVRADIIYLCSPNNPTGAVYSKEKLEKWVKYACARDAVILFDAAYEAFIKDDTLPGSIYEIDGAKKCAIEFCSFSKTAGFTGTRCGYTIVPQELIRNGTALNRLWLRRQTTKFNGVGYIIQRGAAAVLSDEGYAQAKTNVDYYMENARIITETLKELGVWYTGGDNSPYIWMKCVREDQNDVKSWDYFDFLLENAGVVCTPGAGFGACGEGYCRLTAFGNREDVLEAMERMRYVCK